jgi:hypothetical protein
MATLTPTDAVIPVYRGRGLHQLAKLKDPDGVYYDLTGVTFTVFEPMPVRLAGVFSVAVTANAADGEVLMQGAWSTDWPAGEGDLVEFRVIPSDPDLPFPKIVLRLQ